MPASSSTGDDAEWQAVVARFGLDTEQLTQLAALLDALESDDRAPTTVRDRVEAAKRHVADSLVALDLDALRDGSVIADLGSGAGFPGLALAVAMPEAKVRLVESQRRKCEFAGVAAARARLVNVEVVCARAEEWGAGVGGNDAVVARAVAAQPVVLEYAAPLLRAGGVFVDWRGRRNDEEERDAVAAAAELGLRRVEVRRVEPFAGATDRHLHVFVKELATPARYPRRAGVARKRPLGA